MSNEFQHVPAQEIGGYAVVRVLSEGKSHLAVAPPAPGGRRVVLKALEEDCLVRGRGEHGERGQGGLHPSIKDRLGRVRELANPRVANLFGVERDGGFAFLVWEYVEGTTFEEYVQKGQRTPQQILALAREVLLAVESMHALGIVHGALHGRNIIIEPGGGVRLTHVSPLLYAEPSHDVDAILQLLRQTVRQRGEAEWPLGKFLDEVDGRELTLRQLASRLAGVHEKRDGEREQGSTDGDGGGIRRRALVGAAAASVLAVGIAYGVQRMVNEGTPKPPAPFEAGSNAMQPASRPGQ